MDAVKHMPAATVWDGMIAAKRTVQVQGLGIVIPKRVFRDGETDDEGGDLVLEYVVRFSDGSHVPSDPAGLIQENTGYEGWIALTANTTFGDSLDEIAVEAAA